MSKAGAGPPTCTATPACPAGSARAPCSARSDSLIWFRDRTERLFGFRYRIEIYVPAPERQYGYYVFPFLTGDTLAARGSTSRRDRARGALLVRGAYLEEGCHAGAVAGELTTNLQAMASWLKLGEVIVGRRGNLASPLRRAVG